MLTVRLDDRPARPVRAGAPPPRPLSRPDRAERLGISAASTRRGAGLVVAILLHAALLAAVLSVALRTPPQPLPVIAVPLVFEPPAPAAGPTTPAAPSVEPASPPPPVASAPPPEPDLPQPAVALPAPASPSSPPVATPEVATPDAPPPPAPSLPSPALLSAPEPPVEPAPSAAPSRSPRVRPTPRPAVRERRAASAAVREHPVPLPVAPPAAAATSPAASPAAVAAAPTGPLMPPRAVAGVSGNRPPVYPSQARARGEEGTVIVRVQVTALGVPAAVSLARGSGHPALDEAAMTAIRSWRFSPATRGGVPVAAEADVPVAFRLDD